MFPEDFDGILAGAYVLLIWSSTRCGRNSPWTYGPSRWFQCSTVVDAFVSRFGGPFKLTAPYYDFNGLSTTTETAFNSCSLFMKI